MRAKQSAGMQQQVNQQRNMSQHMPNMAQAMAQNSAQAHPQFQQGPPNPQQQAMMQLQGIPMQQQLHQPSHQQQNMAMGPRPAAMPQAQSAASQQIPQQSNPYTPTPQENQYITQMANQLQASTPPQRIQAIQNNMRQMSADQRELLARQGIDPMTYIFRSQATKKFMEMKRSQLSAQGGATAQPAAMMNGVTRPPQARPVPQQGPGPQQNFETPFDQIIGQQQDGLRSQEAGHVVVPASNAQPTMDQRNAARANAQQQMNMQNGGNRMQNGNANPQPQPFWNSQPGQRNTNPAAGVNGNSAAANFANGNQAPSNVLQGQPGGLDNQITRTPSQTPGMPNLNKATAPPGQAPNMWPQRTPQIGQANPQDIPTIQQAAQQPTERSEGPQQRPPMLQNMHPQMQQQLASMPEEQRRGFLLNLQRRQLVNQQQQLQQQQLQQQTAQQAAKAGNARAAMNESFPMSSQPSQPGVQTGPIAVMSNQTTAVPQTMMQKNVGLQSAFAPQSSAFGGPARQQPGHRQQPPQQRATPQHPGNNANPPPPLTKEQARQMDQRLFPAEILRGGMAVIPPEVKTWGQLKEYAMHNPAIVPPGILPKLEHLQAIGYRTLQQGLGPAQPGGLPLGSAQQQAPFAQMVSHPNTQAPVAAPRLPNGMNIPQPTPQEVQAWRARLPSTVHNVSDDQIRQFVMRQKAETMIKNMQQSQNNQMVNGIPKGHQGQLNQSQGLAGQPDVNHPPPTGQAKPSGQPNQKGAGPASKNGQGNRNAPMVKQAQKGVKRNSNDDVVEVPNPNLTTLQIGQQGQPSVHAAKPNTQAQGEKAQTNVKASASQNASNQSQNAASQNARPPGVPNIPKEEIDRRDARLKQLMTEVGQNQPPRRAVPMPPQTKAEMAQRLRDMSQMISRMEASLPTFFRNNPNEDLARQLIETVSWPVHCPNRDRHANLRTATEDQGSVSRFKFQSCRAVHNHSKGTRTSLQQHQAVLCVRDEQIWQAK